METSSYWFSQKEDRDFPFKIKPHEIYSYRVCSQPLKKHMNLKVKAIKKVLSPIPEAKFPSLSYLYTPMSNTFLYPKPGKKLGSLSPTRETRYTDKTSKEKWVEKHSSCFQRIHYRSRSNQGDYAKVKVQVRRVSLISTCEISLQTY